MRAGKAVRLVLGLVALSVLAACGGLGGPPDPSDEPFGHGTPFVAEDGTTVATTNEDADYDIAFASEVRDEPQVPLPAGVERVGPFRRITADGYASSSSSMPFLVGLPVPDGVEPENLAIGFLDRGPVEISLGEGEGTIESPNTWLFLGAFYDAEAKLLLAPFLGVTPQGWEAAVVRSDGFETKTTSSPDDVAPQQFIGVPPRFEATCSWEFVFAVEACGEGERIAAADALERVYGDLTLLGFTDEPRLQRRPDTVIRISGQSGYRVVPGPWVMELRPMTWHEDVGGLYSSATGSFWAVIGTDGVTATTRNTIRHEYFHAIQYSYDPDLTAGWQRARFSIEGQAVLSENSVPSLARRQLDLREIDHTLLRSRWNNGSWLEPPSSEYQAQDFWMFLGQQAGSDLSFLVPFVEEGMAPEDVDAVLKRDWSSTYPRGLADAYWDWVRNQAFESRHDLGGAFGDRCTFDDRVIAETVELSASSGGSDRETFTLGELTSEVVAFELTNTSSTPAHFQLSLELSTRFTTPNQPVKFYDPADVGSVGCWDAPEVAWQSVLVPAQATVTRYALVANAGLGGPILNVTASIDPGAPPAGADLVVRDLSVTPTAAVAGSSVTVAFHIENIGDASAGASTVRVRVNDDPTNVTTSDPLLAQLATTALAAGQSQAYTQTVSLPSGLADGTHYVWVIADVFDEANQSNYDNDSASFAIDVTNQQPDELWTHQFGSDGRDTLHGVAVDHEGNSIAVVRTYGDLGAENLGPEDVAVRKLDPAGNELWTRQFGSIESDVGTAIAVDDVGNVLITGFTEGSFSGEHAGGIFVLKLSPEGSVVWTRQFGTVGTGGFGIGADSDGNVLVAGITGDNLGGQAASVVDVFVRKYSSEGEVVWTSQVGTTGHDFVSGIAVDADGNALVTGYTSGSFGAAQLGAGDVFVMKVSATGAVMWIRQFGTTSADVAYAIAVDGGGNVVVAGYTAGDLAAANTGFRDAFVRKLSAEGDVLWTYQFGTVDEDVAYGIAVDGDENVLVTGSTSGDLAATSMGFSDVFVQKLDTNGQVIWTRQFGTNRDDSAVGVAVDGNRNVIVAGRTSGSLTPSSFGRLFVRKLRP